MWWNEKTFCKEIKDKNGRIWSFKVWHGHLEGVLTEKIFFWDSKKEITGIIVFKDDQVIHRKRINDRIKKIVKDKAYREKFLCPLKFPVENNY